MEYYWTAESFGSEYPPENWEEVITWANGHIDDYRADNPDAYDDEIREYSDSLWELYCSGEAGI